MEELKAKKLYEISKNIRENLEINFQDNASGLKFKPYKEKTNLCPKESGVYWALRVGLTGIRPILDEWDNDNKTWRAKDTDSSWVIAYCPEKLNLSCYYLN